jgi:hypothetical protein
MKLLHNLKTEFTLKGVGDPGKADIASSQTTLLSNGNPGEYRVEIGASVVAGQDYDSGSTFKNIFQLSVGLRDVLLVSETPQIALIPEVFQPPIAAAVWKPKTIPGATNVVLSASNPQVVVQSSKFSVGPSAELVLGFAPMLSDNFTGKWTIRAYVKLWIAD